MTPRWRLWMIVGLFLAVVMAAAYLPVLRRRIRLDASIHEQSEERARRELTEPLLVNPTEPKVKATLFWSSGVDESLRAVTVELRLSSDPVLRAKQVLNTLLAGPVDVETRTLPPDAVLLAFYLLPDGTGIADFSEALATSTPSGIESEEMAVASISRTLQANVPEVQSLKILIHGQEVDTLAGHLDLTGTFLVRATPAASVPGGRLAPTAGTGKLAQPQRQPTSSSLTGRATGLPKI